MKMHTKGKWEVLFVNENVDVRGAYVRAIRPATDYTKENPDICHVFAIGDDGRAGGEMEHNARLIAAAPDMFELFQRINRHLDSGGTIKPGNGIQDAIKAIIAKAEGK
jgi:hypothetical protein